MVWLYLIVNFLTFLLFDYASENGIDKSNGKNILFVVYIILSILIAFFAGIFFSFDAKTLKNEIINNNLSPFAFAIPLGVIVASLLMPIFYDAIKKYNDNSLLYYPIGASTILLISSLLTGLLFLVDSVRNFFFACAFPLILVGVMIIVYIIYFKVTKLPFSEMSKCVSLSEEKKKPEIHHINEEKKKNPFDSLLIHEKPKENAAPVSTIKPHPTGSDGVSLYQVITFIEPEMKKIIRKYFCFKKMILQGVHIERNKCWLESYVDKEFYLSDHATIWLKASLTNNHTLIDSWVAQIRDETKLYQQEIKKNVQPALNEIMQLFSKYEARFPELIGLTYRLEVHTEIEDNLHK